MFISEISVDNASKICIITGKFGRTFLSVLLRRGKKPIHRFGG
jgi:hypothetical protein